MCQFLKVIDFVKFSKRGEILAVMPSFKLTKNFANLSLFRAEVCDKF